ncbi:hypothetical protein ACHAXR_008424 [Thalassiosira sp. AJA248-18]
MCLVWSCVALGLVPYEPSTTTVSGMIYDPLTNLGDAVLSKGGSTGKMFLASVNILGCSAICTTVIGSILASTQYLDDMIGYGHRSNNIITRNTADVKENRKLVTHILAVAPSAVIALCGSSELYYRATSFAGTFPCTLLYGLIPPLCNLRLRWKHRKSKNGTCQWKDVAMQTALAIVSLAILVVGNVSR